MPKLALVFSVSLTLFTSCSTCPSSTFNRSVFTNTSDEIKVISEGQKNSVLNINDLVVMSIGECHPWSNVLCAVITPKKDVRVRFESNEFMEINSVTGDLIATHTADLISYHMKCHTKNNAERICSSSEESPTNTPTTNTDRITEHQGAISETIFKTFNSKLEFSGTTDSNSSTSSSTLRGNREYKMLIIPNIKLGQTPTIVKFPRALINGRIYNLPDVKLMNVTETVCHYRAW